MADFSKAMKPIRDYEGDTYVNDPKDYGGETKCGISKRAHPDVDIKNLVWDDPAPVGKVSAMPIYRLEYWNKFNGDAIADQGLAEELMDVSVNLRWNIAVKWAQHSYNELVVSQDEAADTLLEDGLMGPKTLAALNGYKRPTEIVKMVNGFQFMHYIKRIDEDETQRGFLRSWLRRVEFRMAVR
jgi:lysozyme family protein